MTLRSKQAGLQALLGFVLCWVISTIWGTAAVRLFGHTGREQPVATALILVVPVQIAVALGFWRRWRAAAVGVVVFIVGEAVWVLAAWLLFPRG